MKYIGLHTNEQQQNNNVPTYSVIKEKLEMFQEYCSSLLMCIEYYIGKSDDIFARLEVNNLPKFYFVPVPPSWTKQWRNQ